MTVLNTLKLLRWSFRVLIEALMDKKTIYSSSTHATVVEHKNYTYTKYKNTKINVIWYINYVSPLTIR